MEYVIKRFLDIIVALVVLLALSPFLLFIALLIKLDSPGPIFHRRLSLGKNQSRFTALKFRTMIENADEILKSDRELWSRFQVKQKLVADPRVTRLGRALRKTSIDEIPEFINVIRGEMSLVGPRPIAPDEAERYGPMYVKMLTVKPGITGLWQVNGRQSTTYEQRVKCDMEYIEQQSLLLDLRILFNTIPAVLKMDGAV